MSATILIKRTQGTSPPTAAPVGTGVSFGELIYTYDVANVGAGKSYKKLYIGDPSGNTEAPIPIGGEYYTQVIADNPADWENNSIDIVLDKGTSLGYRAELKDGFILTNFKYC